MRAKHTRGYIGLRIGGLFNIVEVSSTRKAETRHEIETEQKRLNHFTYAINTGMLQAHRTLGKKQHEVDRTDTAAAWKLSLVGVANETVHVLMILMFDPIAMAPAWLPG